MSSSTRKDEKWARIVPIFAAKIVLEWFGGGGAIWGSSEALGLRVPKTQEFWRFWAALIGAFFFLRLVLQMIDYIREETYERVYKAVRLIQIFSAKFVLEVLGGGGAIWGWSEAMSMRRPDSQEFWRIMACSIGFIFLIRWMMQIRDFIMDKSADSGPFDKSSQWVRLVQVFSAKLVLEVFGGAGAIWGWSEVCTLRNPTTQEFWRWNALLIGLIFYIRWMLQIRDAISQFKGDVAAIGEKGQWTRSLEIFFAKFVLEVAGGAGAMWGSSEVLTLRNPQTQETWRWIALAFGVIFFFRFLFQIKDFFTTMIDGETSIDNTAKMTRMIHIFQAKFVLEVLGGGGAIWGSSEALTLRYHATQEFWRHIASIIGAIFLIRFFLQMRDFVQDRTPTGSMPIRLVQVFSAKFVLEVLGGAGACWGFSEALSLRRPDTIYFYRYFSLLVGFVFFCRFLLQIKDFVIEYESSYAPLAEKGGNSLELATDGSRSTNSSKSELATLDPATENTSLMRENGEIIV